jgi:hypothetical protein
MPRSGRSVLLAVGVPAAAEGMTTNTGSKKQNFAPLLMDVAVPIGSYYLLKSGFGMGTVAALGWSSVVPAVRTVWGVVAERTINAFAGADSLRERRRAVAQPRRR